MKLKFLASAMIVNATILASPRVGATLITPVSVDAPSTLVGTDFKKDNLINGVGLNGMLHDTGYTHMWLSNSAVAELTFNLGSAYALSGTYLWQYNPDNDSTEPGVQQFNISTSIDGANFNPVLSATLNQGPGNSTELFAPEFKSFNQTAQFVKFSILSNYGSVYSGLSEVRFEGGLSTAVPEPHVTGLLALSMLGLFALRRKNHFFPQRYGSASI